MLSTIWIIYWIVALFLFRKVNRDTRSVRCTNESIIILALLVAFTSAGELFLMPGAPYEIISSPSLAGVAALALLYAFGAALLLWHIFRGGGVLLAFPVLLLVVGKERAAKNVLAARNFRLPRKIARPIRLAQLSLVWLCVVLGIALAVAILLIDKATAILP